MDKGMETGATDNGGYRDQGAAAVLGLAEPREPEYGLRWSGKAAMKRALRRPAEGTLRADPEGSLGFQAGGNLIIEGDNLMVLKRLEAAYRERVKMIYIDPPYNSGRDCQYRDNYRARRDPDDPGWRHGPWLNMIYPRLALARRLLREDGVLFVSIDDHEVHALRLVLDEIFGEDNFVAMFPWQSRTSRQNDTDLCVQHEYVLAYARHRRHSQRRLTAANADRWERLGGFAFRPAPVRDERYANPDDDPRGPWKADPFDAPNVRPRLTYPIVNPDTGQTHMPPAGRCWRTGPERFRELLADGRILFGRNGRSRPQLKVFHAEKRAYGEVAATWLDGAGHGTAKAGTRELQTLFDGVSPFAFPKPTALIRFLLRLSTGPDDLVLDFFAGSGVTGHATLAQNQEDGGRRRFVLVQRPESLDDGRWPTIAELTRERLRRAIRRYGFDAGFRSFRWDGEDGPPSPWDRLADLGVPLDLPLEVVGPGPLYRFRHRGEVWLLSMAARLTDAARERCLALAADRLLCWRDACGDGPRRRTLTAELAAVGTALKPL